MQCTSQECIFILYGGTYYVQEIKVKWMIRRFFCYKLNPEIVYDTLMTTFYFYIDFFSRFLHTNIALSFKNNKAQNDILNKEMLHLILWLFQQFTIWSLHFGNFVSENKDSLQQNPFIFVLKLFFWFSLTPD